MIASRSRPPLKFFLVTFALSIPFLLIGAATGSELLPRLPLAALMTVCPATAALILVYGEDKTAGVVALLKRSYDYRRIGAKVWYAPILLMMPATMAVSFGLMRLLGVSVPPPNVSVLTALGLFVVFFIAALGEELGWSGYVTDPMQVRWGALRTGLLLGLTWAAFHIVALVQAQRSAVWIAWWCLNAVATRVVMVWLYNNTGKSVFAAALFHTTINVTWMLFPVRGSYFDPRVVGLIMTFVATIVTVGSAHIGRSRERER